MSEGTTRSGGHDRTTTIRTVVIATAAVFFVFLIGLMLMLLGVFSTQPRYHGSFGEKELIRPNALAVGADNDRLLVVDAAQGAAFLYDLDGGLLARIDGSDNSDQGFAFPAGVCATPDGFLVSDARYETVYAYSKDGNPTGPFLKEALPERWRPGFLAMDGSGRVYVTDLLNQRVVVFNRAGEVVLTFGEPGAGDGQFNFPAGIVVDTNGDIYVADSQNHRIQVFTKEGTFRREIRAETNEVLLALPRGIALDGGKLWVVDTLSNVVECFSKTGDFQFSFGTSRRPERSLSLPNDISSSGSRLYVADRDKGRIAVWRK